MPVDVPRVEEEYLVAPLGAGFATVEEPEHRSRRHPGRFCKVASFTQSLTFPTAGNYLLTFAAAGRNGYGGPNPFQVSIDGTLIGATITPSVNSYASYSIPFPISSGGAHTLGFASLGNGGGDIDIFYR